MLSYYSILQSMLVGPNMKRACIRAQGIDEQSMWLRSLVACIRALHSQLQVSHFCVQDVLAYLPQSAHALGWQQDGVAERWYAAGPGVPIVEEHTVAPL